MPERVLDVRGLVPPEPLEQTVEALSQLTGDDRLRLLIHRAPILLYPLLAEQGFDWQEDVRDNGEREILIWRPPRAVRD